LPEPRQVADQAYRSSRYVLALELPRRDGSIVQGSVEGQVDMDVPRERVELIALAEQAPLELGVVRHVVGQRIPVPRWCFRIGAIRPELGQNAREVPAQDRLSLVGATGHGIDGVPLPLVAAQRIVAVASGGNVPAFAVARVEL